MTKNEEIDSSLSIKTLIFIILLTGCFFTVDGQERKLKSSNAMERLIERFTIYPNKMRASQDTTIYPAKIILAPIISFTPETNLSLGVGAKYLFKMPGSGLETRTSNVPISLQYSLNNQLIFYSGFEIFSPREEYMIEGNLAYQTFPRLYYGVGRDAPQSSERLYEYTQLLIEPILLKQVFMKHLFIGAGIRYNAITGVNFESEEGEGFRPEPTGALGSKALGGEFALVYDSRNNLLNATSGMYAEFTHGFYDESFGSSHTFQLTRLDLRYFKNLTPDKYNILAFQLLTHSASSSAPLAEMAFFGSDEMMRGYYEGRYIDNKMIAFQTEYRTTLTNWLGLVAFAGIGDVAQRVSGFSVANLRWSVGLGLRLKLDRRENLNMRLDWGFAKRSNNYYLKLAESF